jgi:hypothetical protein
VGQSARSAQSRQNTWRFRVVNTESRLEAERLPEATFVAPLRIWEVEPDLPAKNAEGFRIARISISGELGLQVFRLGRQCAGARIPGRGERCPPEHCREDDLNEAGTYSMGIE